MNPHKVILDSDLAESLWRLPSRSRREILAIFEKLADYPLTGVEDQIRATDGRMIQRARFNKWRICFWIDGPVDEVRIVTSPATSTGISELNAPRYSNAPRYDMLGRPAPRTDADGVFIDRFKRIRVQ